MTRPIDALAGLLVGAYEGEDERAQPVLGEPTVQAGKRSELLAGLKAGGEAALAATARIRAALVEANGRVAATGEILDLSQRSVIAIVQRAGLADLAAALRGAAGVPGPRSSRRKEVVVERAAPRVQTSTVVPGLIDALLRSPDAADQDLARARIRAALDDSAGDVHAAAKILGVSARTAYRYVARAGLSEHAAHVRSAAGASDPRTKGQVSPKTRA